MYSPTAPAAAARAGSRYCSRSRRAASTPASSCCTSCGRGAEMSGFRAHRALVGRLLLFTAGSFAFGFALVPLYSVLCKVWDTGNRWYGTQTAEATVIERPVADRVV